MKVCLCTVHTEGGGAETYFRDLAKELEARGDEVVWLTGPIIPNIKGIHMISYLPKFIWSPKADLYYGNLLFPASTVAVLSGKLHNKPAIACCEGGDDGSYSPKSILWYNPLIQFLIKWTVKEANRVHVISKYCKDVVERYGAEDNKIVKIPLFIRCD